MRTLATFCGDCVVEVGPLRTRLQRSVISMDHDLPVHDIERN